MRNVSILLLALGLGLNFVGLAAAGALPPAPQPERVADLSAPIDPSDWLDRLLAGSFETGSLRLAVAEESSQPLRELSATSETPAIVPIEVAPLDASQLGSLDGLGR